MLTYIILAVTIAVVYYYFFENKSKYSKEYWAKRGIIVSKEASLDLMTMRRKKINPIEHFVDIYNEIPDAKLVAAETNMKPRIFLKDPEIVKQITVKDFDYFIDRPDLIPAEWEPLWSKNLFALNGHKWRNMRSILSPSFTSSKMKMMFTSIVTSAENFANHFSEMKDEVIEIEMKDVGSRFTNDIIAINAFGIKVDSLKEPENLFYRMGTTLTNLARPFRYLKMVLYTFIPFLHLIFPRRVFNPEAMSFFHNIINETIRTREAQNIVRPDMIHLLMEARKGTSQVDEKDLIDTGFSTTDETKVESDKGFSAKNLTNTDIAAQALVFFFAGFDSVSSFLTFMAYELAVNPEVQERLRREIEETVNDTNGKVTYEAIMKMKYMDMVVSESLRKWPIIARVDRQCIKEYTIPGEKPVIIEKGTLVTVPTFAFHRDPKFYPDPLKFDPERFSDENKHKINPYAYFPFGLGPRNCIGSRFALMEGKSLFFYLLKNFEIVTTEKTEIPPKMTRAAVTFSADGGMHLGFKRIKQN